MKSLLDFINGLPALERTAFADRCGTSEGYLRKICSTKGKLGEGLCINVERETGRLVTCEYLRPDVDWAVLRGTGAQPTVAGIVPVESAIEAIHQVSVDAMVSSKKIERRLEEIGEAMERKIADKIADKWDHKTERRQAQVPFMAPAALVEMPATFPHTSLVIPASQVPLAASLPATAPVVGSRHTFDPAEVAPTAGLHLSDSQVE